MERRVGRWGTYGLTSALPEAYLRGMRARALGVAAVIAAVLLFGGVTDARKAIRPKAGGYTGKVTNANGKGSVQLVVATFVDPPGSKARKGPQLFEWTGTLKCKDGSSHDTGPSVFAPLHGARFSGKSKSGGMTVKLHGRFTANTKLKGTARVVTKGGTPARNCDTGPVRFRAHRR